MHSSRYLDCSKTALKLPLNTVEDPSFSQAPPCWRGVIQSPERTSSALIALSPLYGINPGWLRSFQFSPTYDGIHTGVDSASYTTINNSPNTPNAIRASCSSSNSFQHPPSIWPTLHNLEIIVSVAASILSIGSQESRPSTWQSINWCPRRFFAHGHHYVGLSRVHDDNDEADIPVNSVTNPCLEG